jgi:hypothetical protein
MSQHTPGPWYSSSPDFPIGILSAHRFGEGDPEQICFIGGDVMAPESSDENEANAALIAAAPELLRACKEAIPEIRCLWHQLTKRPTNRIVGETRSILDRIEAAVAKAEGGQP